MQQARAEYRALLPALRDEAGDCLGCDASASHSAASARAPANAANRAPAHRQTQPIHYASPRRNEPKPALSGGSGRAGKWGLILFCFFGFKTCSSWNRTDNPKKPPPVVRSVPSAPFVRTPKPAPYTAPTSPYTAPTAPRPYQTPETRAPRDRAPGNRPPTYRDIRPDRARYPRDASPSAPRPDAPYSPPAR
jgi:hypothetical protein